MHIENNTLLIVPNSLKNNIIKNIKTLVNYKIMSLDEFVKKYYFDYNEESICFLMDNYNIKYDIAKEYLKNIYYVENKKYYNTKLDKLVEIKQELTNNKLLIEDPLFKESLKNKKIVVYGYNYIEKTYKELLDSLNASFIEDTNTYNNQELYEFTTSEEEIDFMISRIVELIDKGISLNNIKIVKSEYDDYLKDKLKLYDINIPIKINLYGTNIIKLFLTNLSDIEKSLDNIKNNILLTDINLDIYNKLINILNKYTFIENKESIREILINEFKNSNIIINYKEQIEFINLEENIGDNYVFLPGFNIGMYPHIIKDEDYITDNIKELVNLEKTSIINKKIKKYLINKIKHTNNLVLTYRTKEKQDYYVSTLNEELNLKPIKNYKIPYYINIDNKIKLARKLDLLRKYNEISNDLDLLYSNYKIDYNSYDNRFSGIKRNVDHIKLSYTDMNKYYECSFKYYLDKVLKINIYEETFNTIIGSLFHYVLQNVFEKNKSLDESYNEYINSLNKTLTNKEKVFLNSLKEELKLIIETINKQLQLISLDKALYEEEVIIDNNTKVTFTGKIDKLLYKEQNDTTYIAIIDYKTGSIDNKSIDLTDIIYGFNLQLPVYLYLAKNSKLKNIEVLGFYLQPLLNKEIKRDNKKTYLEQKENNLKLIGYTNEKDTEILDKTYQDSNLIVGLKTKNDGLFYSSSKVLNNDKINKIIDLVDNKINESTNKILNNEFDINPKYLKEKNKSCEFCKYKDVCYKTNKDIVYLEEYKDLEFLK